MAKAELTPEQNLRLLQEIEANRAFILRAYQSNPDLLKHADQEIRRLFEPVGVEPTEFTEPLAPKFAEVVSAAPQAILDAAGKKGAA